MIKNQRSAKLKTPSHRLNIDGMSTISHLLGNRRKIVSMVRLPARRRNGNPS